MEAIIRHKDDFIWFPDDPLDVAPAMRRMENIVGFPNVVGVIDGSHITIKAPQVNHEDYFNRKQNDSNNLQGVVDAAGKFIDVRTGCPDSIHCTAVFNNRQGSKYFTVYSVISFTGKYSKSINGLEL